MSKYIWHFDVHYVEVWDNTYLDIITEEEKKILEYLWKCKGFWDYFSSRYYDAPPDYLDLEEISDEDIKVIRKYIHYCKSYYELIWGWLDNLYYDKFGKWPDDELTLEQVKQLVNDSNS